MNRAGEVTDQFFSLLCKLEKFDLRGNPSINKKTLAGHLACTFTNLKDQASIDASSKNLTGAKWRSAQARRRRSKRTEKRIAREQDHCPR